MLFKLGPDDLRLILEDFPRLDSAQPGGGSGSSVTKDLAVWMLHLRSGTASSPAAGTLREQVEASLKTGAVPYVPSDLVGGAG